MPTYGEMLRQLVVDKWKQVSACIKETGVTRSLLYATFDVKDPAQASLEVLNTLASPLGFDSAEQLDRALRVAAGFEKTLAEQLKAALYPQDIPLHPVTGERIPSNFTIKRLSSVAADEFAPEFEVDVANAEEVPGALHPEPMEAPELLLVVGDSMTYDGPDCIENGDWVLYGSGLEEEIPDGEIVVARHVPTESKVVKVFQRVAGNMCRLHSLNPKHGPIDVPAEQVIVRRVLIVLRRRLKRTYVPSRRVLELLKSTTPNPPRNL